MEKQHILKEQWTVLPSDVRIALRKKYDLRITESTYVIDDRVISDGVTQESLARVFSVERMKQELPNAPAATSSDALFALIVRQAKGEVLEPVPTSTAAAAGTDTIHAPEPAKVDAPAPKKTRTKKTK
jgi:hypothetical protein